MSLAKSMKSHQRIHKERSQPQSRGNLGPLEKKKDYKLRAKDYQQKRNKLKVLRKKALNKNPDEFYFHMINSELKDSFHYEKEKPEECTEAQLKLMQTQDIKYVNYKHSIEAKKIEKLKSGLHLLDVEDRPKNNHTFFVNSKVEAKAFDVSSHLQTHSSLLDRTYNRPRLETLKRFNMHGAWSDKYIEDVTKERRKQYQELGKRIEREHELSILSQKLDVKKKLLNKNNAPVKVKDGSKVSAPVYLWKKERKR